MRSFFLSSALTLLAFSAQAAETKPFRDCADCPQMVTIPPGLFMMGSTPEKTDLEKHEAARVKDERPRHEVKIAYSLAVSRTEVTKAEFAKFSKATNFPAKPDCWVKYNGQMAGGKDKGRTWDSPGVDGPGITPYADNHPVICVGWDDAVSYATWLAKTTGKPYRLLTESEWEYAAGGSTKPVAETLRPWGDSPHETCTYGNGPDETVNNVMPNRQVMNCNDGHARTAPVASYKPNAFGLYDTMGNVWEWVADCWAESYKGAPADGSAVLDTLGCKRGMRGSSWSESLLKFRTAARGKGLVDDRGDSIGIRVGYTLN